ncbi:acylphosphatase [Candidatus Bipolaricaulota bacterium]|nr:acylphosphatase [Candidatus Bipolaricaulota bacterium]
MQERLDTQTIRAHLLVAGRVQGVLYRASTRDKARSLGLRGWVRNLPDGRVEIIAQGRVDDVQALITWAHNGPPLARVNNVDIGWEEPQPESGFGVR